MRPCSQPFNWLFILNCKPNATFCGSGKPFAHSVTEDITHFPVSGGFPTGAPINQSVVGYCFGSVDIELKPKVPFSIAIANIPVCMRCIKNLAVGELLVSRTPTISDLIKYKSPPACGASGIFTSIAPPPVGKFWEGSP